MSKKKKPPARTLTDEIINDLYFHLVAVSEKIEAADPKDPETFRALLSLALALGKRQEHLARELGVNAATIYQWRDYGILPKNTQRSVGALKRVFDVMLTDLRTRAFVERKYLGMPYRRAKKEPGK